MIRSHEEVAEEWNRRHPRQRLTARQVIGIEAAALQKLRATIIESGDDLITDDTYYRVSDLAKRFGRAAGWVDTRRALQRRKAQRAMERLARLDEELGLIDPPKPRRSKRER
jgi:hypothetical protein